MDADELRDEVERLREENAELSKRAGRRVTRRSIASGGLLVLGCLLVVLSVLAIWLRATLLDTDRYVDTVGPVAEQPAVQKAVADKLSAAIDSKVDYDGLIRQVLPDQADALAPALASGLSSAIHSRVEAFTASDRFETLWIEANRRAHSRLVELLTGGESGRLVLDEDTVYLDLVPAVATVRDRLRERGYDRLADAIPADVDGRVALVQSDALVSAQSAIKLLKGLAVVLPVLALLCLGGAIFLAASRRRGLLRAALGVALSMLVLVALVGIGRSAYLDALGPGTLPRDAAADIFDTLIGLLRDGVRLVVLVAIVIVIATLIGRIPGVRVPRVAWVGEHQRALQIGVAIAGSLALLAWSPLTAGVVLIVLVACAAAIGLVAALATGSPSPG